MEGLNLYEIEVYNADDSKFAIKALSDVLFPHAPLWRLLEAAQSEVDDGIVVWRVDGTESA